MSQIRFVWGALLAALALVAVVETARGQIVQTNRFGGLQQTGPVAPTNPPSWPTDPAECHVPPVWIPKLVDPDIDLDGNYVEDDIDQLPGSEKVDAILALNRCPTQKDRQRFLAAGAERVVGDPYLAVVYLEQVPVTAAIALGQDPAVAMVFFDHELTPNLDVSSPAIKVGQSTEYSGANLEDVFPAIDGQGINVAVIDSGIDFGHESLPLSKYVGGLDFSYRWYRPIYRNPDDTSGHGTHVAGIIAGEGGPNGPRGIAPGAGLVDVKVLNSGRINTRAVMKALSYCLYFKDRWNIRILHLSIGDGRNSRGTDSLSRYAQRCVDAGLVVVGSMANSGSVLVQGPAAADGVIAVGNADALGTILRDDDVVSASSSQGPRLGDGDGETTDEQKPTCVAPGVNILAPRYNSTTLYDNRSGTSAAAAHVSGMVALLLQSEPGLTPSDVYDRIVSSSERMTAADWDPTSGHGEVDAYRLLRPTPTVTVQNLGLSGQSNVLDGNLATFEVWESWQGGVDLNGDGDSTDPVFHVHDAQTGVTTNLGLAGVLQGIDEVGGDRLALFLVNEGFQNNTDLNGDGDTTDSFIPHVYDRSNGQVTNLGLEGMGKVTGNLAFWSAREGPNGFTDLNGDGDASDGVLHVFDADTLNIANLGITDTTFQIGAEITAILVRESSNANTDLNGDGDTLDDVLHVYVNATGQLLNAGLAVSSELRIDGSVVAVAVLESTQGNTDLNGDGDTLDRVLFAYDATSAAATNTGLATDEHSSFDVNGAAGDRLLAAQVTEADQGNTDLNGDGDTADGVIQTYDLETDTIANLGLASLGYLGAPSVRGRKVAFLVSESQQNGGDLNGDGDSGDQILHVRDVDSATTINVGVDVDTAQYFRPTILEDRICVAVRESAQGNTDLNGDGDATDSVLHVYDLNSDSLANVGLATNQGSLHYVRVFEANQGNTDFNGDGDTLDVVLFAHDAASGWTENVGLAWDGSSSRLFDTPITLLRVGEDTQGNTDLNGDGDATDKVFHLIRKQ